METVFAPWQSLSGDALIGFTATLLMLTLGGMMITTGLTVYAVRHLWGT